jgi:hypothetical protein
MARCDCRALVRRRRPVVGFVGLYLVGGLIPREVGQVRAPGDAEYEVVRSEAADVIDPIWYVSIRQTRGLFSRQWELAASVATTRPRGLNRSTGMAQGRWWSRPRVGLRESASTLRLADPHHAAASGAADTSGPGEYYP